MEDAKLELLAFHLLFAAYPGQAALALKRFGSVSAALRAGPAAALEAGLPEFVCKSLRDGGILERAASELEKIRKNGYHLLSFEDEAYPEYLKEITGPPALLYVAGRPEALAQPAVALVGSRRPSPYGLAVAEKLATELAGRGCVIVSGLALGIDAAAHWGALRRGGVTVAVLGSGLDVPYPRANRSLYGKIAEKGAVVSEFPLGTRPHALNFPVRNRLISGLSLGVVVVEAAGRSGALITAKFALEQDREVMAVPGSVTNELSRGPHGLIKDGARLVEGWEDVAEGLPSPWKEKLLAQKDANVDNNQVFLTAEGRKLLELVPADGTAAVDELAERADLSLPKLLSLLLELELQGAVVQRPGKMFQRRL